MLPCKMFVGNTVTPRGKYGKTPVLITKMQHGRFYTEDGRSWKYGIPVYLLEKD